MYAGAGRAGRTARARPGGHSEDRATCWLTLPFHHLYLDALAVLVLAALFWRFNLSALGDGIQPGPRHALAHPVPPPPRSGFATWPELVVPVGPPGRRPSEAAGPGPACPTGQRLLARPRHYAIRLGRAQWGKRVLGTMEANWLLLAPPRKGKSGALADWILDWPGAVIATSTRADLFTSTAGTRWRRGVVHVFNPFGIGNVPSTFGWDPVAGCQDPAEAFTRADALIGPRVGRQRVTWRSGRTRRRSRCPRCCTPRRCPAATVLDIWDWANRSGDAIGGSALAHHPAASSVLRSVFAEATREGRSPDSIRMTMAKSLTWVAVPSVAGHGGGPGRPPVRRGPVRRRAGDPVPGGARHARAWSSSRCSAASWTSRSARPPWPGPAPRRASWTRRCCWPWTRSARSSASRWTCGWPTPPVRACASSPSPTAWASSAKAGETDGAATIWDTTNKIILPGVQDRAVLDEVAAVCGQVGAREGDRRVQVQAVPPAFVSRLPARRAFILAGGVNPVVVKLRPVWARLSSRLRLAVAPPPLSACQELDLKVPELEDTPQTWVDRTRPLDGVLEPAGAPDLPDWAVTDGTEDHQA